ncbi:MAG: hypothetical protein NVS1B13_12210 [Flavisolibacter sp.]
MICVVLAGLVSLFVLKGTSTAIDFNTQVKPILNKNCITCHGGVRKQANFSLLFASEALSKTKSGKYAIVPGDPGHSEMIRRVRLTDPEERMPYHHPPLNNHDIDILSSWIKQGAKWGKHWAYVPVHEVAIPKPSTSFFGLFGSRKNPWIKNDIDYFIDDKLRKENLSPSIEADKPTLLRRVSLDLTGLPPSGSLAKRYLQDNSPNAYQLLVDSLLASPHYGERWTSVWLDLARYADTKGYERDAQREIWHYRDWLIEAFNSDKPYNQFLIEQLAGDLLKDATDEQFIATAFHRNTMTNDEGGTDNEEFRTAAVIDRVNTTWQALLGTTFSCVQCHSHPYDPFAHDEYYKFMAFFNDTRDEDTSADYPLLRHYSTQDSLKLQILIEWLKKNNFHDQVAPIKKFLKTWQPSVNSILCDEFTNSELNDTKWLALRNHAVTRLKNIDLDQKDELIYRYTGYVPSGVFTMHLDKPNGPVLQHFTLAKTKGWTIEKTNFQKQKGVHDLYFSYTNPKLKKPGDNAVMFDWFYFTEKFPGKGKQNYDTIQKIFWQLAIKEVPTTPIMMDNPADMHRPTHVFARGNWLVKGKEVTADVPHALNPFPKNKPHNRLGLAAWITDKNNPLTARTMVNRLWEQIFGTGLVETLEDLGTQGADPSHKELLDFLSFQFMGDYQWSLKKILREMVLSATYRQDARMDKKILETDPYNRFYERGARIRLSAEAIRDQALAASGLLNETLHGPSVMPWQPEGIWMSPWNGAYWKTAGGGDQYRRALYTYWKRTAPYPSLLTYDGIGKEVCTARRIRTNTPLQALVTLNDSVYVEAARYLAYRMEGASKNGSDIRGIINRGYEFLMFKPISLEKLNALYKLFQNGYDKLKNDKEKTCAIVGVNNEHNNPKTAALVIVAGAVLNLDEVINKN